MENNSKTLEQIIKTRKSTRNFINETPPEEYLTEILNACIYAPYGGATGIPLSQIRHVFVFRQGTESMEKAREIILSQVKGNSKFINRMLVILPFLRKKMKAFSNRLKTISANGIPALNNAAYFIVVAEKNGFPPVAKQSIAHAMQNMWLTATELGLGFQLISATSTVAKNKQFSQLLNLKKGAYTLDGCAIGYPQKSATKSKELNSAQFVTFMS